MGVRYTNLQTAVPFRGVEGKEGRGNMIGL